MVQEKIFESMIRNQPFILEVPPEILLKIYTLVIGTCGSTQQPFDIYHLRKSPIALDLLLVNRKIYAEARLLPFQLTMFNFNQWNGTGIQYCNSFLRRICEWQAREIRHISLGVVGVNVDHWKDNGFVDICKIPENIHRRLGNIPNIHPSRLLFNQIPLPRSTGLPLLANDHLRNDPL